MLSFIVLSNVTTHKNVTTLQIFAHVSCSYHFVFLIIWNLETITQTAEVLLISFKRLMKEKHLKNYLSAQSSKDC